ncbi:uncharacterized protein LAJ45_02737 [Morchella importuna]|uniref:uncharacterized protein n=1 Tax=Morchella importuna TaxID=1174673 RepID=UPI001E8E1D2A|nr:uncharacterized protein LAJ45_02737 [Morchella importuna]KAH8153150.1 hypothetical protein LAJ45_02737 [Morchella importuna]
MPPKRKPTAKPPRRKKQQRRTVDELAATTIKAHNEAPTIIIAHGDSGDGDNSPSPHPAICISFTAINTKAGAQQNRKMTPPEQCIEESTAALSKAHAARTRNRESLKQGSLGNVEEGTELSAKMRSTQLRKVEDTKNDEVVDSTAKIPAVVAKAGKEEPLKVDIEPTKEGLKVSIEENVEGDAVGVIEESTEKGTEGPAEGGAEGNIEVSIEGNIENPEPLVKIPAPRTGKNAAPKQKHKDADDHSELNADAEATKPTKVRKPRKRPPRPPFEKWVDPDPYIPRTTISKHARQPVPVSFPSPSTHVLESRPTQNGCLWCRWNHKCNPDKFKIRKSTIGCKECNIPLCRECFVSFHAGQGPGAKTGSF